MKKTTKRKKTKKNNFEIKEKFRLYFTKPSEFIKKAISEPFRDTLIINGFILLFFSLLGFELFNIFFREKPVYYYWATFAGAFILLAVSIGIFCFISHLIASKMGTKTAFINLLKPVLYSCTLPIGIMLVIYLITAHLFLNVNMIYAMLAMTPSYALCLFILVYSFLSVKITYNLKISKAFLVYLISIMISSFAFGILVIFLALL